MKFVHSPLLSQALPVWRARLLLLGLLAGFVALALYSLYLQSFNSGFLQEKGASRYSRVIELSATRGRITDRHGEALAVSTPVKSIWAIPEDAKLQPAQARELAGMLEMDVSELSQKLATGKEFVYVKRQIAPDVAEKIAALNLPGIHDQREYRRYYPSADVTAHMLGFTGAEDIGQEGIELAFQNTLAGKPGERRVIKDRRGQIVEDVGSIKTPQDGKDVTLALDSKIQYLAYANLHQAITENKAKAGGIVVLDAKTGEVLALANAPTYNPNNRIGLAGAQLRNRALTDIFEPGSTMKPFAAALALEKGKFRPETTIQTAPGYLRIGSATIHDSHMHGILTVSQVIQKSSNVGAAKMALAFPPQEMWSMFDSLGFGTPLKLGFPGEVSGRLRPAKTWRPIEQATMAYGHGISVTFSAQTAREVRAMLELVVLPGGPAPKAQVAGYRVAGKTGTAHKLNGHAYINKYVASFVGFAPASDPRLIVAVMIDEPSTGVYYGGDVAAPVFSRVMAGSLRTLGVAPDADEKMLQAAAAKAANEAPVKESM